MTTILWILLTLTITLSSSQTDEDGASLAFVFDITGSMYDDLVQVIEGARKIMDVTLARRVKPLYNYILVPFHDPDIGPAIVTRDPEEFVRELEYLFVYGGDDCPEMSIGAIKEAIDIARPNSFIYVFTDARSKDYVLTDDVLALIQQKQSQIVFVLTGTCGNQTHEGFLAYEKIASTSSGQVFVLNKDQVNQVLEFVKLTVQAQRVNLMSIDNPERSTSIYYIPVDDKLKEFTVSVSGVDPEIRLWEPGQEEEYTEKDGLRNLLDIKKVKIMNVQDPVTGKWKLEVNSNSSHTVRVHGLSSANFFVGFSRKQVTDFSGTTVRPLAGVESFVIINTTDLMPPAELYKMQLLDLHGNVLSEYPLERHPLKDRLYSIRSVVPPKSFFYIQVTGLDEKGNVLQRLTSTAIKDREASRPQVYMSDLTRGYYDSTIFVTCEVFSEIPFTVQWLRAGKPQGKPQQFSDSSNATLEIPNATEKSEGLYMCNATNKVGWRATQTFLDVSEPPPSVIPPLNVSVLPGDDAMLTCFVYSTVDFNVTWYKVGRNSKIKSNRKFNIMNNGSLIIRNVEQEDDGKYVCRVGNEGGFTKESTFLIVQVPPEVTIEPKEQDFQLGRKVSFLCRSTGYPHPDFYWLRAGALLISGDRIQIRGGALVIRDVTREDEGSYQCMAQNPAGESVAVAQLNFIEKPEITLHQTEVMVAVGDLAVLECSTTGIPPPIVTWYKGDIEITALSYVKISDDGQLTILGTQAGDAGKYRCVASNNAGSTSATTHLTVGSEPRIVSPPQNTGADIESNATLSCRASGLPRPDIQWKFAGSSIALGGRFSQLPGGELFIQGIIPEDEGQYTCVVKNRFGTTDHTAYLTVTGMLQPVISHSLPYVDTITGKNLTLGCDIIQGHPKPSVHWMFDGHVIQDSSHFLIDSTNQLSITNIQEAHEGDYTCLASNIVGNTSSVVSVNVHSLPKFRSTSPGNYTANQGNSVTIPCDVEGNPKPLVTWYKDESPISRSDIHYVVGRDDSLQIFSADTADTGNYRCQASNIAGSTDKTFSLFVRKPPTIEGEQEETLEIIHGEPIDLSCLATGVPQPKVSWRKEGQDFQPTYKRFNIDEFGLSITKAREADTAIYECVVENEAGETTKTFTVKVQTSPTISETNSSSNIRVTSGGSVTLNCEVKGDPVPMVTWKKDGVILDTDSSKYEMIESGTLVVHGVSVPDQGLYLCQAENSAGTVEKEFDLTVYGKPTLPDNLPSTTEVVENEPVTLVCPAVGSPPPVISWFRNGIPVEENDGKYVMSSDGSLNVLEVKIEDEGSYKCVATNDAGSVEREVTLDVQVKPRVSSENFDSDDRSHSVVLNGNITLTCPLEGDPQPMIKWYKDGMLIQNREYILSEDSRQLMAVGVTVPDSGQFTCEAENVAGKTNVTFDLDVVVPPHVDKTAESPDHMTVIQDKPLVINCPISGTPFPKITWYKDGEIIGPDDHVTISMKGRQLTVMKASVESAGEYKCLGENPVGSEEKVFSVEVHVPPTMDNPNDIETPEAILGGNLKIVCPAKGFPLPNITWFINSKPIRNNTERISLINDGWTLEIRDVQETDGRRYVCRADNEAGSEEKSFDLNVLLPSSIPGDRLDLQPKVMFNQPITLSCPAEGNPLPVVTWYKNDHVIDFSTSLSYERLSEGKQLRILSASEADIGKFSCIARNRVGEDKADFDLKVLLPARIDTTGINTSPKVIKGQPLTLVCPGIGLPLPNITWFKDGLQLYEYKSELKIDVVDVRDAGSYKCLVENEVGSSELDFEVKVQVPPSIDTEDLNQNLSVIKGRAFSLFCPTSGTPSPSILWYKNSQILFHVFFKSNPNLVLRDEGRELHFYKVDEKDVATYKCSAVNPAGEAEQEFDFKVLVPPSIDSSAEEEVTKVIKGHSTILYCPASGSPQPQVHWYKDGRRLSYSDRLLTENNNQKLIIVNATLKDHGNYSCVARNPAGEMSKEFPVTVLVPPGIDESNVYYNPKININRTVLIDCPIDGIPQPEITWFVNNAPFVQTDRHQLLRNNRHLKINGVQVEDAGIYTCQGVNEAGSLQKNFKLTVQLPAKIDKSNLKTSFNVVQNQSVVFDCPVSGTPQPSVTWLKDTISLVDHGQPYKEFRVLNQGQRLEVINAQVEDAGRYTCEVSNAAGSDRQHFDLDVAVPPSIEGKRKVAKTSVLVRGSVNLECLVEGTPRPNVTWLKDNEPIDLEQNPHIRVMAQGQVLQIFSSQREDTGRYTCQAKNSAGIAEKYWDLQVQVPPKVTGAKTVQQESVILNQQHVIHCPASGIPPPLITWKFKGEVIPEYGSSSYRILDKGKQLLLTNTQLFDAGLYTCTVTNSAGETSLNIQVEVQMPPTIAEGSSHLAAEINSRARLPCETDGIPKPYVTWSKNGRPFPVSGLRHAMVNSGSLEFVSVQLEDAGNYTCHASNPAGNVTKTVSLNVQVKPRFRNQEQPTLYVVKGQSADVPCDVEAYPPPTIMWQLGPKVLAEYPENQRSLNSDYQIINQSTLRIKEVGEKDSGTYICIARNHGGTAIGQVKVIITDPPKIAAGKTDFTVSLGGDILLPCSYHGNPEPMITWEKDGRQITHADFHYRILRSGALAIPYTRSEDTGTYTCKAHNSVGTASVDVTLTVEVPPVITEDETLLTSVVGQDLEMTCEAVGVPPPIIRWYRDNREIERGNKYRIDGNGTLTILDLQASDSGAYTCEARSVAGRDTFDRHLRIQEPPLITQSPDNLEIVAGSRFYLRCQATGKPVPLISWLKNGKPFRARSSSRGGRSRLTVRNARTLHAGLYTCIASNPAGTVTANATVILKEPPQVTVYDTEATAGTATLMSCYIGDTTADIIWIKDGRQIVADDRLQLYSNGSIGIYPVLGSDAGEYKCIATNDAGFSEGIATLTVQETPVISGSPKNTTVSLGDTAIMDCLVEGEPQPDVSWYSGQREITHGGRFSILPNNSLRILATQTADAGAYLCKARNNLGETEAGAFLSVMVHGGFSSWSQWSVCSVTCGTGTQYKTRQCDNPTPQNGGRECEGPREERNVCSDRVCPVAGDWGAWEPWSECSVSCDQGIRRRHRVCSIPLIGGLPCVGDRDQTEDCNIKSCFRLPTKAEGNLVGYINGIDIPEGRIEAQTTPTSDGTQVNATIDNLPPEISGHIQHLISALNPVYWSLAQEVDGASNGYRLTDGHFTRETQVQFATGEILKMSHYVTGLDEDGVVQYDVIVSGSVPDIPVDSDIQLYPYTEDYIQTGPSSIYSHSSRLMRINGHMIPYAWNHTISYDQSHGVMPFLVEKLNTKSISVGRDSEGRRVQFSLVSQISPGASSGQCPHGFLLHSGGSYCTDDDECLRSNPCSHYCHNSPGSYSCSCNPGYSLDRDGQTCKDVNECLTNNGGCNSDSQCINIEGSFLCAILCKDGYRRSPDGQRCIDIDECRESPSVCGQSCQNLPGGYVCSCSEGFELRSDGTGRCTDINECTTGQSSCSHVCRNTIGSYNCDCPPGYRLYQSYLCEDVDECRERTHECRSGQDCVNTRGSYQCTTRCPNGYQLARDGSCTDVNECVTNQHRCYSNQRCINTIGSYYCQCQQGYRSKGPGQPCLDVNECSDEIELCQHNCTNTVGSFRCICPLGYRLARDGRKCVDINECIEQNVRCGPERMCFNQRGDFSCVDIPCPRNYRRDPLTNHCVLECVDSTIPCPPYAKFADVIEFRTLALPSGFLSHQDLIRLTAYDHLNVKLLSNFTIIENDPKVNFYLRPEEGSGIVFTQQPLVEKTTYKIKVSARSLDNRRNSLRYQTTFVIHISVSAFPY